MKNVVIGTLFALLLFSMDGAAQAPADGAQQHRFRSAADVVTIQASVRDHRGRSMRGLTAKDFEVLDNGQPRPILSLRGDAGAPVSLAILVDTSGSMRAGLKMGMARQAVDSVVAQLRQGDDEVAVFTFDSSLRQELPFTTELARVQGSLDGIEPFGSTSLFDATAATARKLAERAGTRKAIVVLTDGVDTSSKLSAPEVSGLAASIDVPVYVVATVPNLDQRAMMESIDRTRRSTAGDLRDLAEWTGGHLAFASTPTETVATAASLVQELRQRYILAIEAAGVREWRRLEVRVRQPSTTVKARSGYFGG